MVVLYAVLNVLVVLSGSAHFFLMLSFCMLWAVIIYSSLKYLSIHEFTALPACTSITMNL